MVTDAVTDEMMLASVVHDIMLDVNLGHHHFQSWFESQTHLNVQTGPFLLET
jgi:hypothetical protein